MSSKSFKPVGGRLPRQGGVTLMELMIVLVVIGILASIAVPSYREYLLRSNRAEARAALLALATAQEKYYLQCNVYTTALDPAVATRCAATGVGANLRFPTTSERGYYTIAVTAADATGWTATATAVSGQPQFEDTRCRTYQVTSQGVRTALKSSGAANDALCWDK